MGVDFTKDTAERILRATQTVERQFNGDDTGKRKGVINPVVRRGILDEALSDTDGSGSQTLSQMTLQDFDGTAWADTTDTLDVRVGMPLQGSDLAVDSVVWVTFLYDNWFVIAAECSSDGTAN